MALLTGKTIVVTGAGNGIGRAEALRCAREGARVIVNDLGCDWEGDGADPDVARAVADEIVALGGEAVPHHGDVTAPDTASALVELAVSRWGRVDGVVNNAGILRDWMIYNMPVEDWQAVIATHLTAPFLVTQAVCRYWRECARSGAPVAGRVVNTTSVSGLLGNRGQTSYGAAKAGVAALTRIAAMEMRRFGVTVNAIAPAARTRMTENSMDLPAPDPAGDAWSPDNVAPLVAYLLSDDAGGISGQVLGVYGDTIELYEGWNVVARIRRGASPAEIAGGMGELFADREPVYERSPLDLSVFGPGGSA